MYCLHNGPPDRGIFRKHTNPKNPPQFAATENTRHVKRLSNYNLVAFAQSAPLPRAWRYEIYGPSVFSAKCGAFNIKCICASYVCLYGMVGTFVMSNICERRPRPLRLPLRPGKMACAPNPGHRAEASLCGFVNAGAHASRFSARARNATRSFCACSSAALRRFHLWVECNLWMMYENCVVVPSTLIRRPQKEVRPDTYNSKQNQSFLSCTNILGGCAAVERLYE